MEKLQIDVIVPTKNRPVLTSQAIDSVLAQTHSDLRVLVVDDGSSEDVHESLQEAASRDSRVHVIRCRSSVGPQAARQVGYDASSAEYIATLDSDDLWMPRKLETQLEVFRSATAGSLGAVISWHMWTKHGAPVRINRPRVEGNARPLLTDNMSSPLIRREALAAAGGFVPSQSHQLLPGSEHIEFWIRLHKHCAVAVVEEVLVECRADSERRESDTLRMRESADALAMVARMHAEYLADYPSDYSALLARTGARYLNTGYRREAISWFVRAIAVGSMVDAGKTFTRYAPLGLRSIAKALAGEVRLPHHKP